MATRGAAERGAAGPGGLTLGFVARSALVVIGLWALANMLWMGREVVFTAFFAVLVASFLSIFAAPLERLGLPRALAALLVLLVFVGLIVGFFWLTWPTLQEQFGLLRRQLPVAIQNATDWVQQQWQSLAGEFGRPSRQVERQLEQRVSSELGALVSGALPMLNTLVGAIGGLFVVTFAGLFMASNPRKYARGLALLVPRSGRPQAVEALVEVGEALHRWMLGTVISMTIIGVLAGLGFWLVGVPAALVLGVIAGLLEFIPYFGPALTAVPAVALALTVSPTTALWALVVYAAVQALESNVIHPLVMKEAVELPPALTLLWVALMGVLFGFLGLFLAVPILAAAKVLVERLYVEDVANES